MNGLTGPPSLSLHRVRDVMRTAVVTCDPAEPTVAIARRMASARVGSVIVVDGAGNPVGIVTDRDLRNKVVAEGRDAAATRAEQIMSAPLVVIRPAAFTFEALLAMTRGEIHHLVVVDEGRLAGVVTSHDILRLSGVHPVMLARQIATAPSVDELSALGGQVVSLVGRLVDQGAAPSAVGHLVAELNDRTVLRVLGLTLEELEAAGEPAPPVGWCWIVLGSEARREQTLRTDQDNALVYADPPADLAEPAARFFTRFAERAIDGLVRAGFPLCPGGSMASNPQWRQPLAVWKDYFRGWMAGRSQADVLAASIYFDLRPVIGATELAASLSEIVRTEAPEHHGFLTTVAKDVVARPVPLTLFGNVRTNRRGPHRGAVDVKGAGSLQLVGAARLLALQLGLDETNTLDRLQAAAAREALVDAEVTEISDAFEHLARLRLRHQLALFRRGEEPDNFVVPDALAHADQVLFVDALRTVRRTQARIRERFATDFAP